MICLGATERRQNQAGRRHPVRARHLRGETRRRRLVVGAVPPLADGLIVNRKDDLLNCPRGRLGGSREAGKCDKLLAVGRPGKIHEVRSAGAVDLDGTMNSQEEARGENRTTSFHERQKEANIFGNKVSEEIQRESCHQQQESCHRNRNNIYFEQLRFH